MHLTKEMANLHTNSSDILDTSFENLTLSSHELNRAVDETDSFNPVRLFLDSSCYFQAKTSGLNSRAFANMFHIIDYFKPRDFGLSNDQYARFEGVDPPIERIGEASKNGFINLIQYSRGRYETYAVLKSSTRQNADNLMYEYMVGQYVNKLNKSFPCFVETYGYYIYKDNEAWEYFEDDEDKYDVSKLEQGLELQHKIDYAVACENSDHLAILIQYLPTITALSYELSDEVFLQKELVNVLFQIYMPLSVLENSFTHYDLHSTNVNVCEPDEDSYIEFHYHMDDGTECSFKSKYIAKMIDYGRSYFNDKEAGIDSTKIYKEICAEPKCKPDRGKQHGIGWMSDRDPIGSSWIISQKRNKSRDLRLLKNIETSTTKEDNYQFLPSELKNLLSKLKYNKWSGTPEREKGFPDKIQTVREAAMALKGIISDPVVIASNDAEYSGKIKLGDLHIYCTGPDLKSMKFMENEDISFDKRKIGEQTLDDNPAKKRKFSKEILKQVPKKQPGFNPLDAFFLGQDGLVERKQSPQKFPIPKVPKKKPRVRGDWTDFFALGFEDTG